ncbi:EscU/YscU/HrcU family type III secretion system export apparatus switch protein [Paenisporosarcina cavernae]|uniref:Type III secretion system protein n=1 Tax=Paenisporosarcina cavernae TaxID=2320858 RepID=A0A385YRK7_9BACL|nr:EscU/YscU/HrcU family type III secretion system export apparatus switch protein [Paenisporosarcina cavernae]AYC29226.1 type III secretion system protein [Paenisporosarcina cavernae]
MSDNQEKRKEAVALSYSPASDAPPIILAKGKGKIAETILSKAAEHNIPIQEDPSLVSLLGQLNINEAIPEELYQAVAEVFAFIYRVDKEHGLKRRI